MNPFIKIKKEIKIMPKIIENVREMIIEEAKSQLKEGTYDSMTIRSIARGCGIGLGTFYNYFKSKDMLIAAFLLEDWMERVGKLNEISETEDEPLVLISAIHSELNSFIRKFKCIFSSAEAKKSFNNSVTDYHRILRFQIAEPIKRVCERRGNENPEFLSEFAAEAVLTWTVEGKSFEEISSVINKLFIK